MTLSVVIGTRNRLEILRKCLDALIGKIDVDHEIVVVDAGSTDGTVEYLDGLEGIRLVCDGKPIGQAQSLNRVFRTITSEYVCWLSDDNVVLEGMLDLAVSILEQNPDIGMVALKTRDVVGSRRGRPYIGAISLLGVLTCNQGVIRTELLKHVGYFDEEYVNYGIDVDLTMKVLLEGYKVVYTKKLAIHHYRDHSSFPGAIANEDRSKRAAASGEIYLRKYRDLVMEPFMGNFRRLVNRKTPKLLTALYRLARRFGISLESWTGYNERDWTNLLTGRYISKLDFFRNRQKPYYLVQSIPRQGKRNP